MSPASILCAKADLRARRAAEPGSKGEYDKRPLLAQSGHSEYQLRPVRDARIGASQLFKLAKLFKVSVGSFFTSLPADGRQGKSTRSIDQLTDRHLLRLIEAFENLKDRGLRSAVVEPHCG